MISTVPECGIYQVYSIWYLGLILINYPMKLLKFGPKDKSSMLTGLRS